MLVGGLCQASPINRLVVALGSNHFWRQIVGGAAERPRNVRYFFGEPKIGDFQVAVAVEKKILGLEITINNVMRVQIIKGESDFGSVELGHWIGKALLELAFVAPAFVVGVIEG